MLTRIALVVLCIALQDSGRLEKDYQPPSKPRSETKYGAIHREIRGAVSKATSHCDAMYPPTTTVPEGEKEREAWLEAEDVKLRKWSLELDAESDRLLGIIAKREHVSLDEIKDIEVEGNARGWDLIPRKRKQFNKTEGEIQKVIKQNREILAAFRKKEKLKKKPDQKE